MFHLAAYTEVIDNVANTDINALTDDILFIQNNHFIPQTDMFLVAAWMASATLTRVRINTPKLRQITPLWVRPLNVAVLPPTDANVMILFDQPMRLNQLEEIAVEATSGVAMTERFTGLLWLAERIERAPSGDPYNLRFTSTTTAAANAWSTLAATYDTQLPVGRYSVVGGECQSTNIQGFRCIFDQQYMRPGTLGITALGNRLPYPMYMHDWLWGRFHTTSLPRVQVLCNGADNSFEGYLKIVRVA